MYWVVNDSKSAFFNSEWIILDDVVNILSTGFFFLIYVKCRFIICSVILKWLWSLKIFILMLLLLHLKTLLYVFIVQRQRWI